MSGGDLNSAELFAWGLSISLVFMLVSLFGKHVLGWLILKLYELFIMDKSHIGIT